MTAPPVREGAPTLLDKYRGRRDLRHMLEIKPWFERLSLEQIRAYLYLAHTASEAPAAAEAVDIDARRWADLLSGDGTKIRAAVAAIGSEGQGDAYTQQLLGVLGVGGDFSAAQRVSAGNALAYLGDPRDFDEMIEVPAGEFLYGEDKQPVTLESFKIGTYPVTNAQYKGFLDANLGHRVPSDWHAETRVYPEGKANHPVVQVSCEDAQAYCQWAKVRLPTEQEWEKAARGTDGRQWPWGDEFDSERANTGKSGIGTTTPVGCYPDGASPYGCLDMAGNVWEWTDSAHDKDTKVVRSGSWLIDLANGRCTRRTGFNPVYRDLVLGFRVAE